MKKSIAVSIIIPYYNVEKNFFNKCLDSIKAQNFQNFEVIIINDGSREEFISYLESKVAENVRCKVIHQENKGVSEARNLGINLAQGETICFVDADDYVAPWMLEDLWNAYSSNDVEAACAYYQKTSGNQFVFERNNQKLSIKSSKALKDCTLIGMNCNTTESGYLSAGPVAVLFRSEIAKTIRFPEGIHYMEDVIWNYQFYNASRKIAVVEECMYAYRQNMSSATHSYSLEMIDERIKALQMLRIVVGNDNDMYALRVLANYAICCNCCVLDKRFRSLKERQIYIQEMSRNPIWDSFKKNGVDKKWNRSQKLKRLLALSGLMPLAYAIKNRRK